MNTTNAILLFVALLTNQPPWDMVARNEQGSHVFSLNRCACKTANVIAIVPMGGIAAIDWRQTPDSVWLTIGHMVGQNDVDSHRVPVPATTPNNTNLFRVRLVALRSPVAQTNLVIQPP